MIKESSMDIQYWTMVCDIEGLYSGGENDPSVIGKMDAEELCVDRESGEKRPWEVECVPRARNKVEVRGVVFRNEDLRMRGLCG
ncbi:hypothetical protein CCP3SC1AL1_510017 [Gammaproteobacteria bacterium]